MSWDTSEVMGEFLKIAVDKDMLGIKKTAAPEKNPYQEDLKTIEEKRQKSPEKSIIEVAHPESAYIAEARGDGGLVENQLEQQKKLIEMINKHPTGSLVGRYANAFQSLIKMAEQCEDVGEYAAADSLTDTASQILEQMSADMNSMLATVDELNEDLNLTIDELGEGDSEVPFEEAPEQIA